MGLSIRPQTSHVVLIKLDTCFVEPSTNQLGVRILSITRLSQSHSPLYRWRTTIRRSRPGPFEINVSRSRSMPINRSTSRSRGFASTASSPYQLPPALDGHRSEGGYRKCHGLWYGLPATNHDWFPICCGFNAATHGGLTAVMSSSGVESRALQVPGLPPYGSQSRETLTPTSRNAPPGESLIESRRHQRATPPKRTRRLAFNDALDQNRYRTERLDGLVDGLTTAREIPRKPFHRGSRRTRPRAGVVRQAGLDKSRRPSPEATDHLREATTDRSSSSGRDHHPRLVCHQLFSTSSSAAPHPLWDSN